MKVLAVGGGSGGHVTPVVAVINQLHERRKDIEVRFVCDKAFEAQARGLMEKADTPVKVSIISAGKFRRYKHLSFLQHFTVPHVVFKNVGDVFKVALGFIQSVALLLRDRPDVVFAKGGYVCLPMGVAAGLLRIPLVIHDSDTRPGLTNKVLARYATKIATGAPLENYSYDPSKSQYVGVPIGAQFTPVSDSDQRAYKEALGVNPDVPLVVATGGGLGSVVINAAVVAVASSLLGEPDSPHFYNVTGKGNYDVAKGVGENVSNYQAVPFVYEHMERVLGAADIVISRASATFIQELAGLRKAAILVPARQLGDQLMNAAVYQKAHAAVVLTDDDMANVTPLRDAIVALLRDTEARQTMAAELHDFARPNAAADVAAMIDDAAK